jgi:uncharacterized protein YybS (DUF2232 family)
MALPDGGQQQQSSFVAPQVLLITAAFFVPIALPSLFGWVNGLLAVPVFLLFALTGDDRLAGRQLFNGILIAAGGALLVKQGILIVFGLSMLPLGYSLYRSSRLQLDAVAAGTRGGIVLALSWFVFWAVYGITAGTNPYANLLLMLDGSFGRIIEIYRNSADLPPDVLYSLEQIVTEIRNFLPKVLPGLLAGSVLITVWLNLVISGSLIQRLRPEQTYWQRYPYWSLPDRVVWLAIGAGLLTLAGRGSLQNTGYCLVIVAAILYFFQGLAVFIHFLDRLKVPAYLRIVLYVILAVQSYGILILSVIGIADIWFDFRRLNRDEQIND